MINNINASFVAHEDRFTVTPVFHVFEMYAPHQGASSVRAEFARGRVGEEAKFTLPTLSGSCSMQGKRAFLTVVNAHATEAQETEIHIRGARVESARARVLTARELHARNTFAEPNAVHPADDPVNSGSPVTYTFKPGSVSALELNLG